MIESAKRPLVLLDYDGTLRSYVINPHEAVPDKRILSVLQRLSQVADVYVVSGRDGKTLGTWLGHLQIGLVCEHGLALKLPGGAWETRRNVSGSALVRLVRPLFEEFVQRTPGSAIEIKQSAIAWHSRAADPEYSQFHSKELVTRLGDLLKRRPYKVLRGNRVIEVRHEHVTKGSAVGHLLERHPTTDFVFCAGDDRTDEDMMRALPETLRKRTIKCWVGAPNAYADYWRESNLGLLGELEAMVSIWEARSRPQGSKKVPSNGHTTVGAASRNVATSPSAKTRSKAGPRKSSVKASAKPQGSPRKTSRRQRSVSKNSAG
jgi:trehalose 6-phosphate synthase/phosphatase